MATNDLAGMSLSYEAGLDEIDAFFATPSAKQKLPTAPSSPSAFAEMHPEEQQTRLTMDDDDPFAQMMKDMETMPDEALFGSFHDPSLGKDFSFGQSGVPPNPYLPGTASLASHEVPRPALQPMSSQTTSNAPMTSTPVNRATRKSHPNSSGNRTELHAEMRNEEAEASSPIETSPPHSKFTLPGINTALNPPSALIARSDAEIFSLRKPSASASDKVPATKRERPSGSPCVDAQRQSKRPKDSLHFPAAVVKKSSIMSPRSGLSETLTVKLDTSSQQSSGQSTMIDEKDKQIADRRESTTSSLSSLSISPPTMPPPATSNNRTSRDDSAHSISGQSEPIKQELGIAIVSRTQVAASGNTKKRKKGPARKEDTGDTASGRGKRIPRNSVGRNDLKDLGITTSQNGGNASPRKTRTQRTSELEAQPNAGAAAKRRHSMNLK